MSDHATSPSTEGLERLVAQKRRLLEQMLEIGRRQGELIESGDITTLLRLLTGKQQLIAALRAVERGLDEFRHDDPERRVWASPARRAACAVEAEACRRLLAEVIDMEKTHEQQIERRRDGVSDQLRRAQGAHEAATAYQPHVGQRNPIPVRGDKAPSGVLDLSAGG